MTPLDRNWKEAPTRLLQLLAGPTGLNIPNWQNRTARDIDNPPTTREAWTRCWMFFDNANSNYAKNSSQVIWPAYNELEVPSNFGMQMVVDAIIQSLKFFPRHPGYAHEGGFDDWLPHISGCEGCQTLVMTGLEAVVMTLAQEHARFYPHLGHMSHDLPSDAYRKDEDGWHPIGRSHTVASERRAVLVEGSLEEKVEALRLYLQLMIAMVAIDEYRRGKLEVGFALKILDQALNRT